MSRKCNRNSQVENDRKLNFTLAPILWSRVVNIRDIWVDSAVNKRKKRKMSNLSACTDYGFNYGWINLLVGPYGQTGAVGRPPWPPYVASKYPSNTQHTADYTWQLVFSVEAQKPISTLMLRLFLHPNSSVFQFVCGDLMKHKSI